jgi:hypothetical protein
LAGLRTSKRRKKGSSKANENLSRIEELDSKKIEVETKSPDMVFDVNCKICQKQVGVYYFDKKVYFLTGAIEGNG